MSLSESMGSPIQITMANGTTVKLSPITVDDFAALEQHVREQRLATFAKSCRKMATDIGMRAKLLTNLITAPVSAMEELQTAGGVQFIVWRVVSRTVPNLSINEIGAYVGDVEKAFKIVSAISGFEESDGSDPTQTETPTGEKSSDGSASTAE